MADRLHNLLDVVDGVRYAGVFGHALVCEVNHAFFLHGHVLEESVAADSVVDVRFAVLVEVDNLGIAATFEVEYAVVVPAVFVVTDEETLGVGRESGLAGTREAEEDSGVLAVHVGVGRAVHGSDALEGEVVVHHREHTLLHFAAVPGVDDNLFARGDVEYHCGFAVEAEFLVVGELSLRSVVHEEVGSECLEFFSGGADKHVSHEVSLPCHFHDEAHSHAGVFVGTAEAVHYIELLVRELLYGKLLASSPCFFRSLLVVVGIFGGSPPYGVLRFLVENDELVFRRTAGVDTCHHVDSAEFGHYATLEAFEGGEGFLLEEFVVRGVVYNFCCTVDAVFHEVVLNLGDTGFLDFFNIAHCVLEKIWCL